jgi:hypothetical protein
VCVQVISVSSTALSSRSWHTTRDQNTTHVTQFTWILAVRSDDVSQRKPTNYGVKTGIHFMWNDEVKLVPKEISNDVNSLPNHLGEERRNQSSVWASGIMMRARAAKDPAREYDGYNKQRINAVRFAELESACGRPYCSCTSCTLYSDLGIVLAVEKADHAASNCWNQASATYCWGTHFLV